VKKCDFCGRTTSSDYYYSYYGYAICLICWRKPIDKIKKIYEEVLKPKENIFKRKMNEIKNKYAV